MTRRNEPRTKAGRALLEAPWQEPRQTLLAAILAIEAEAAALTPPDEDDGSELGRYRITRSRTRERRA